MRWLPTDRSTRRRLAMLAATVALLAVGAFAALRLPTDDPAAATSTTSGERPAAAEDPDTAAPPLAFEVDPALEPSIATIPGLRDGDAPRPVARVRSDDGIPMDLVLDEILVTYDDDAALDRFVALIDGEVVDRFDDGDEPVRDALVAFPRREVDDPAAVAAAMVALEHDLAGTWTVSDPAVLAVLDLLGAAEEAGVTALPNAVAERTAIADGSTRDGDNAYGRDAFTWPYVASGTAQDIGLDAAWRLLQDVGAFDPKPAGWANRLTIMVVDQGFALDDDLPEYRQIRRADWGDEGWGGGSGSWHGTSVTNALLGKVDNGFGGAGPAGPLDPGLIAVGDADPSSWGNVRSLVRLVEEHRPDIVSMSYRTRVTVARLAYQDFYERKFSTIKHDHGALPFASAGNESENIDAKRSGAAIERAIHLPCEARHVVCVGGMGDGVTQRADTGPGKGSNYGTTTGGRSVEIWGPYYVVATTGEIGDPAVVTGTSLATPFVAGVAALVKAADPSLDPDGVWNVLKATAHEGGLGAEVTGHQRRINARDAVLEAYGQPLDGPQVTITSPGPDASYHPGEWIDLTATTRDHQGRTNLAVTWSSDLNGTIAGPTADAAFTESLSVGTHRLTATVTDGLGRTEQATVRVHVVDRPLTVTISAPAPGARIPATAAVSLIGNATDDTQPLEVIASHRLRWRITTTDAPGTTVAEMQGRTAQLPVGALPPGTYVAHLSVTEGSQTTSEQVPFEVVEPDPEAPTVQMHSPANGFRHETTSGSVTLLLRASAHDWQGNPMSATRLRWVARNGDDEQVLCTGSDTPKSAPGDLGGLAAVQSCNDVEVALDVPLGTSTWSITVEVYATPELGNEATRGIQAEFTPPPVP